MSSTSISKVLQDCYSILVDRGFYSAQLVAHLYSKGFVNSQEKARISSGATEYENSRLLLDLLIQRDDSVLDTILEFFNEERSFAHLYAIIHESATRLGHYQLPPGPSTGSRKLEARGSHKIENAYLHTIAFRLSDNVGVVNSLNVLYGQLGLQPAAYSSLRRNCPDNYDFLKAMLAEWISLKSDQATLEQLCEELRNCRLHDGASCIEAMIREKIYRGD